MLGEQSYKNIAKPVRTYTINEGAAVTAPAPRRISKLPAMIAAAVLAIAGAGYWGYQQYDAQRAERARVESELAAQLAAQKQATEQARRAAEEAKRDAQLQAQKQAADEALRRAQEERTRLEQDRKLLEAEKRAADAAKKQAEASQRAAPAATAAPKRIAQYDGVYNGQLCNQFPKNVKPNCWSVALVVRNGTAEGNWLSPTQKASKAAGTVAADGTLELKLTGWTRQEVPIEAVLTGRIAGDAITASGQWRGGVKITGNWKRTQTAAAAPAATIAPKSAAQYDGTYNGQLCNHSKTDAKQNCWPVELVVRNGIAEASWLNRFTQQTSRISGTVAANGAVELSLTGWTRQGNPINGALTGRAANRTITASGQWRDSNVITGNWTRTP